MKPQKRDIDADDPFKFEIGQVVDYAPLIIGTATYTGKVVGRTQRADGTKWYRIDCDYRRQLGESVLRAALKNNNSNSIKKCNTSEK